MNVLARKPTAPADTDDVLAVLEKRLRELDADDKSTTEEILLIEKTVGNRTDSSADTERAEALLDGETLSPSSEKPIPRLTALHAKRDLIRRALDIGRSRAHRLAIEKATQI